jgi:hypothetical protein
VLFALPKLECQRKSKSIIFGNFSLSGGSLAE